MNIKENGRIIRSMLAGTVVTASLLCSGATLTVKFNSPMEVEIDGEVQTFDTGDTFVPTAIPCLYRMRPVLAEGERTFAIKGSEVLISGHTEKNCRFPLLGENEGWVRVALDPYPAEDTTVELTGIKATGLFYADAENGNDEWDGTADYANRNEELKKGPKKSLQAAHDAATGDFPIVLAAPGTYNTGVATNGADETKFVRRLVASKNIGFIATAGAGQTFITGAADPATGGQGPDAIGGVFMAPENNNPQFLQGFTITGCYSLDNDNINSDLNHHRGIGFCSSGFWAYCLDCVISNNSGRFYAASSYGVIKRTKIADNVAYRKICNSGVFVSCVFSGNMITNGDINDARRAYQDGGYVYFCTYDLRAEGCPEGRKKLDHLTVLRGSLVYGLTEKSTISDAKWNDSQALDMPFFTDADEGDYRLAAQSPAHGASSYAGDLTGVARYLMTADVDGRLPFLDEGRFTLGAVWADPATYSVWYVDCVNGDDADSGMYGHPKKTIRAATADAVSGDVIYVAPGTYGDMEDSQTVEGSLGSRVVVPDHVVMESTGGAENTIIVGAAATGEQIDNSVYGTGTNAVRCVYAGSGSVVRGFTLTGGRGVGVGNETLTDCRGAAFLSSELSGAVIEDCIVSNNAASVGTIYGAVVRRCRVFGNTGVKDNASGAAGLYCSWYGSVIDGNFGSGTVAHPEAVEGCTIGVGNRNLADTDAAQVLFWYTEDDNAIINTAVLGGKYYYSGGGKLYCTNCYVKNDQYLLRVIPEDEWPQRLHNTVVGESGALASVDENYRPLPGTVTLIDNGDVSYSDVQPGDVDVYGTPRVLNGTMDIGAVEYDWRTEFSAELGRRFTITGVPSATTINAAGGLVIADGAVSGKVRSEGPYKVMIEMVSGSAEVYAGDELLGGCSGAGIHTVRFIVTDPSREIRIVYVPDAVEPSAAVLKSFANARGFVIGIR